MDPLLEIAARYLSECFARGTPPSVKELAVRRGLTSLALGRAFRNETGTRLSEFFKNAQIERAKELLLTTDLPVDAIARAAAFGTRTTFFRAFKNAIGVTPAQFRMASDTNVT